MGQLQERLFVLLLVFLRKITCPGTLAFCLNLDLKFQIKYKVSPAYAMSSRKSTGNGFFQFCREKQKDHPEWGTLSPPELVELFSPFWCNLTVKGRSRCSRESREALDGGSGEGGL